MATKPCQDCGHELNEAAIGCPECGAKWSEDGEYLGPPEGGTPPVATVARRVADMTVSELWTTVFWATLAAAAAALVILWLVGLVLGGLLN